MRRVVGTARRAAVATAHQRPGVGVRCDTRWGVQAASSDFAACRRVARHWRRETARTAMRGFHNHPASSLWMWLMARISAPIVTYRSEINAWVAEGTVFSLRAEWRRAAELRRLGVRRD